MDLANVSNVSKVFIIIYYFITFIYCNQYGFPRMNFRHRLSLTLSPDLSCSKISARVSGGAVSDSANRRSIHLLFFFSSEREPLHLQLLSATINLLSAPPGTYEFRIFLRGCQYFLLLTTFLLEEWERIKTMDGHLHSEEFRIVAVSWHLRGW